jgi:hypothetical protein
MNTPAAPEPTCIPSLRPRILPDMELPPPTITLTAAQVECLRCKLGELRHNVNNCLAQITAAAEISQRKPTSAPRLMVNVIEQPGRIVDELERFSKEFEAAFGNARV